MRRPTLVVTALLLPLCFLASSAFAGRKKNKPSAESPQQKTCVILKRMGPADEVTSHLYSFGFRGKQYQYEEGPLPKGIKFHGRLTDKDVRKIQAAGGRVVFVDPHYTDAELDEARKSCTSLNSESLITKAALSPVMVNSTPASADITVDGKYAGSTPSKLELAPGPHTILLQEAGYFPWQRTVTITPGDQISISPTLDKKLPDNAR